MKLSVIIPCYNELKTIGLIIDAVRKAPYEPKEIIIVDDCSRDGTRDLLQGDLRSSVDHFCMTSIRAKALLCARVSKRPRGTLF